MLVHLVSCLYCFSGVCPGLRADVRLSTGFAHSGVSRPGGFVGLGDLEKAGEYRSVAGGAITTQTGALSELREFKER